MKANKIEHKGRFGLLVAGVVLLGAVALGVAVGYDKVRDLYLEQCVVTDMSAQVRITAGNMVKADVIAENLGLRKGANLALIDFTTKRKELLEKVPNLLSIQISRHLPDKVSVVAEERTPVARMGIRGQKKETGRVVDTEGMVFVWQRGTQTLPVIREAQAPGTPKGYRIKGRMLAALRLIEACREPELLELGILEVDASKHDFLVATLGNYSRLKICWDGMDESTPASRADLDQRLMNLRNAIRAQMTRSTVIWNATIPNRIFADTQETP